MNQTKHFFVFGSDCCFFIKFAWQNNLPLTWHTFELNLIRNWKSLCYVYYLIRCSSQGVSDHTLCLQIKINTFISSGQVRNPSMAIFLYYLVMWSRLSGSSLPILIFTYCVPKTSFHSVSVVPQLQLNCVLKIYWLIHLELWVVLFLGSKC